MDPSVIRLHLSCVAFALCAACSSTTAAPDGGQAAPRDAAPDATVIDAQADVVSGDGASPLATSCDAGTAPASLPQVTASWVVLGGDGGATRPTPSGGDPTGTWVVTNVTVYLSPMQAGELDTAQSSVTGTAWAALTATDFSIVFDLDITLNTTVAGIVRQGVQQQAYGTYTQSDGTLTLDSICHTTATGAGDTLGFSRDSATAGRLFVNGGGMGGALVLNLTRVP